MLSKYLVSAITALFTRSAMYVGISLFPGQTLFPGLHYLHRKVDFIVLHLLVYHVAQPFFSVVVENPPRRGCPCGVSVYTCQSMYILPTAARPCIPAGCLFCHISGVCDFRQSSLLPSRVLWHYSGFPSDLLPACSVSAGHNGSLRCCPGGLMLPSDYCRCLCTVFTPYGSVMLPASPSQYSICVSTPSGLVLLVTFPLPS